MLKSKIKLLFCSVLVQPRETRLYITKRLLIGRKESNQTRHPAACAMMETWVCPSDERPNHYLGAIWIGIQSR